MPVFAATEFAVYANEISPETKSAEDGNPTDKSCPQEAIPHRNSLMEPLVSRERAADSSGAIDIWHARPHDSLELVRQRLELALEQGGNVVDAVRFDLKRT